MGEVHEVAAQGFQAEATAYDSARPSYPQDAVAWLIDNLGIAPGRTVIDLAAGTGKLTTLLTPAGADLIAIEPIGGMRDRLRAKLPGIPLIGGVAEAMPLAGGSADAIVAAQAFHWFDAPRALAELHRVLRPGGRLGLVWNARDRGVDWVDQVWSVMDRVEKHAPWRDHGDGKGPADDSQRRSERTALSSGAGWSGWTEENFYHVQISTPEQVVDRIRSVSHVAVLPPRRQREVLDEVRAILREHPVTADAATVQIGYRVDVMYCERLG
jgi:SAM-dependent methyltransferase